MNVVASYLQSHLFWYINGGVVWRCYIRIPFFVVCSRRHVTRTKWEFKFGDLGSDTEKRKHKVQGLIQIAEESIYVLVWLHAFCSSESTVICGGPRHFNLVPSKPGRFNHPSLKVTTKMSSVSCPPNFGALCWYILHRSNHSFVHSYP